MIRIFRFTGGLGNQIFCAAVCSYFRHKYPKDKLCICYSKDAFDEHNGSFELAQFFDVDLPTPNIWYMRLWNIIYRLKKHIDISNIYEMPHPTIQNEKAIFYYAFRLNKKYIPQSPDWLKFKKPILSLHNAEILKQIKTTDSIFIHVRRGDYLSTKYVERFKDICTIDYYHKAIKIVQEHFAQAKFFIFSDDIEYVKHCTQYRLPSNYVFVNYNKGLDSYLDMYLMAHCKGGIIANSTFSYWGARLIQKKFIVYPKKWVNGSGSYPNLFEDYWVGI